MWTIFNFMVLIQRRELVCDQHRYKLHKMTELQPAISNFVTHDLMPHIFMDIFVLYLISFFFFFKDCWPINDKSVFNCAHFLTLICGPPKEKLS